MTAPRFRVTLETGPFNVRVHVFEEHASGDATLLGDLPGCYPDTALVISERLMGASAEEEREAIAAMFDETAVFDDAEADKYEERNDRGDSERTQDLRRSAEANREHAARIRARGSK